MKELKDLHVSFMTFCDYATISRENKLSILGMFDEIRVTQLPGGLTSAFLVAIVKGQPDTDYHLSVRGDLGKKMIFAPIQMEMKTGAGGGSNIMINLNNVGFVEAGDYKFSLLQNDKEIAHTHLRVVQVTQPVEEFKYKLPN